MTELPSTTPTENTPAATPSLMSDTVSPALATWWTSSTVSASMLRKTMNGQGRPLPPTASGVIQKSGLLPCSAAQGTTTSIILSL